MFAKNEPPAPVETDPFFKAGTPKMVFKGNYPEVANPALQYSVTHDGQRFLMKKPLSAAGAGVATHINVILNWLEEVKARVPSGKK